MEDVQEIIRLIADAADPTLEIPVIGRKRRLLEKLSQMIGADVFIWSTAVLNPHDSMDAMTTCLVDGGWASDEQKVNAYRALTDPRINAVIMPEILPAAVENKIRCLSSRELFSEENWDEINVVWGATGLKNFLMYIYPLGNFGFSGTGFHRLANRPDYTERERAIVCAVLGQVDWLHRQQADEQINASVVQLTPRQRQVLILLLEGTTLKAIAQSLQLSEHTVGDYVKQIHKHFDVNSRAELQAKFFLHRER